VAIERRTVMGSVALLAIAVGPPVVVKAYRSLTAPKAEMQFIGTTKPVQAGADGAPVTSPQPVVTQTAVPANGASEVPSPSPTAPKEVVVHVAGMVRKPGVYHLALTARAEDALKAAGGAKEGANLDAINLAERVEDGKHLYVPSRKETPEGGAAENPADSEPVAGTKSAGAPKSASHRSARGDKLTTPGKGTVNINRAGLVELQRLPGVGPAMSERILQFRKENGSFSSPDQLMDVKGIGEKKFAKMEPFVRVR
jgi:competence protein ComEA